MIRWRINTNVQWFRNGHWETITAPEQSLALVSAISSITSTYRESDSVRFAREMEALFA